MSNKGQYTRDYNRNLSLLRGDIITSDGVIETPHEEWLKEKALDMTNEQYKQKDKAAKYFKIKEECQILNEIFGGFVFLQYGEALKMDIDTKYLFRFIYLSTYVNYDDVLMLTQRTPMNREDIKEVLALPNRTEFSNTMKALLKYDLIKEENEKFYVSRQYIYKGKTVKTKRNADNEYTRIFIDGIRSLYKSVDRKNDKDLGYIFKLLPYIHKEYNFLCLPEHINYDIPDRIKRLNTIEVGKMLNLGRKKTLDTLMKLRVSDMPVIIGIIIGSSNTDYMNYYINPFILYQGNYNKNKDYIDFLIREFKSKMNVIAA